MITGFYSDNGRDLTTASAITASTLTTFTAFTTCILTSAANGNDERRNGGHGCGGIPIRTVPHIPADHDGGSAYDDPWRGDDVFSATESPASDEQSGCTLSASTAVPATAVWTGKTKEGGREGGGGERERERLYVGV